MSGSHFATKQKTLSAQTLRQRHRHQRRINNFNSTEEKSQHKIIENIVKPDQNPRRRILAEQCHLLIKSGHGQKLH
jgi:hypothetical protein